MEAVFSESIGLRSGVWNRLFSNRLFSRNKKDNGLTKNMVIIGSTQDTCWYADYKFRTSWIAFNAFSRIASTSAICCLSSSADPGISSRLLQMALPSLTLVSSSCFFCLGPVWLGFWLWLLAPKAKSPTKGAAFGWCFFRSSCFSVVHF